MPAENLHSGDLARRLARLLPAHYGWVIVVSGLLTVFACLGIGRFALGMLLPSMGISLDLSYADMGLISTGNFIGYLLAVLGCGRLVGLYGARAVIGGALLTVGLSLLLVSRSDGFLGVLLLYAVTGFGSGAAALETWCGQAVATLPAEVDAYRAGQDRVLRRLVGEVMKLSRGSANPAEATRILKEIIATGSDRGS